MYNQVYGFAYAHNLQPRRERGWGSSLVVSDLHCFLQTDAKLHVRSQAGQGPIFILGLPYPIQREQRNHYSDLPRGSVTRVTISMESNIS